MSKTAREVLLEWEDNVDYPAHSLTSMQVDKIIAALDAAGFVIVPKADLASIYLLHQAVNFTGDVQAETMAAGKAAVLAKATE